MAYELLIYRIAHQLLEEKAKQRENEVKEKGGKQERIWGKDKGKFKRENKEAKKRERVCQLIHSQTYYLKTSNLSNVIRVVPS